LSEHLHPDFRHVLGLTDKGRLDFIDQNRWIGYPVASQIIETLRALMEKPSRPRMPNLLIVGEPNNGKTTLVSRFMKLHGEGHIEDDSVPIKPVVTAEAPPSADEKGLYISILERFFAPYRATDSTHKLRYQVVHQFRSCRTRLLIIDEFHSMLTGSAIKQREVMNAIKALCNELAIPVVGVGTREAVRILHTDPQHASRFDVVTLPLWQLDPGFQRLLANFESVLPLKKPSRLSAPELATALHAMSGGNMGDLHRLLDECTKVAITSGKEMIDLEIVQRLKWVKPTGGVREISTAQ
jgi:hypothetical protein